MCTRDKSSYAGGGFVEAVVSNDLLKANNSSRWRMCKTFETTCIDK